MVDSKDSLLRRQEFKSLNCTEQDIFQKIFEILDINLRGVTLVGGIHYDGFYTVENSQMQ